MHRFFNKNMIKPHIFLGLLLLPTAHLHAMTFDQKMITSCVIFAGITSFCRKPLANSKIIQKVAQKTNTNAQDIADIIPLSALTWAASHLTPNLHKQRALRYGALVAPCVMALTTHPTFNKYTSYLFGCTNAQCKGICDECKTAQIYKALPFKICFGYFSRNIYNALAVLIPTIPSFTRPRPIATSSRPISPSKPTGTPVEPPKQSKDPAAPPRPTKLTAGKGPAAPAPSATHADTTEIICQLCEDEKNNATAAPRCSQCTYITCEGCILGWLITNQSCPQCRNTAIDGSIINKPTPQKK
jgi:hypothetical protein